MGSIIANGATMERIRKVYLERLRSGYGGPPPGGPPPQPASIQERMATIRNERFKLLGLDPDDPASGEVLVEWGARLFGAPALAVICMNEALLSKLDIRLFVQTVCLTAQGYGVDPFIARAFTTHQDVLRQELEIPQKPEYYRRYRAWLYQSRCHHKHLPQSPPPD